jgi:hypothetical protein
MTALLTAMRDGGPFGVEWVDRFNGGLFAEIGVEALTAAELKDLHGAGGLDWGAVEPAIFGTLFERSLDPGKTDIERVLEPVVMTSSPGRRVRNRPPTLASRPSPPPPKTSTTSAAPGSTRPAPPRTTSRSAP